MSNQNQLLSIAIVALLAGGVLAQGSGNGDADGDGIPDDQDPFDNTPAGCADIYTGVQHAYPICIGGFWHTRTVAYYIRRCPGEPDEHIELEIDDVATEQPCGAAGPVALTYCESTPTSLGFGAHIEAYGSQLLEENTLQLAAWPVPETPGIFYFGPFQTELPFGNGIRCVGGSVIRLPVTTATGHVLTQDLDLMNLPGGGLLQPGDVVHFQAWFRDPTAGGSGFNLSDAVSVSFQ